MATQVPSGEGFVSPASGGTGQPSTPPGMASAAETPSPMASLFPRSSSRTPMMLAEAAVGHPYLPSLCPALLLCALSMELDPKASPQETSEG